MRGGKDVVLLRNALSLQRKGMVDAADQRKRAFRAQSRVRRAEHTSWRRGCSLPLPARFRCWAQLTPANFQAAEDRQYPHAKQSGRSTSSAPRAAAAAIHRSAACTRHGSGDSQRAAAWQNAIDDARNSHLQVGLDFAEHARHLHSRNA